jgi:uncharacterized protein with HEPN domain
LSLSERELAALDDVEAAAKRILAYIKGLNSEQFTTDSMVRDAVTMNFVVIGEAVNRLPGAVTARFPGVPWRDVVSLRNRIVHGYATLQPDRLWTIATREVGELLTVVQVITADVDPPEGADLESAWLRRPDAER